MEKVVLGIVDTPAQAETTVQRLEVMGFPTTHVSLLFPDKRGTHDFAFEQHTKAPEGAIAGAAVGAMLGAALGMAAGLGVFIVPGLGALAAAGPVLGALSVAAAFAIVFAVVGTLLGLATPEIQAKHYAGKVTTGSILVGVHVESREQVRRAREVLRSVAAADVVSTGEAAIPASGRA